MKLSNYKGQIIFLLFISVLTKLKSQTILTVDTDTKLSDVSHNPTGYDLCWFLSEDTSFPNRTTSTEDAIINLGIGSIRWPYGHLADNYLWTWPLEKNPTVLSPRTATINNLPHATRWPNFFTDVPGSHSELKDNTQDFDEFMTLILNTKSKGKKRVEPVIMVNLLSYLYNGGPTVETLVTSAANWVYYANTIKGYNIKYWQIGNEVESEIDFDIYYPLYIQFKNAMKAIDPTIQVGFGSYNSNWFNKIGSSYDDQIDFMSLHQYKNTDPGAENYETYRTNSKNSIFYLPKLKAARNRLRANSSNLKIMMSEFSSHSYANYYTEGDTNSFYKSMIFFEMLGEILTTPEILYSHVWGLHNPWNLDRIDDGQGLNNNTNTILPIAFVTKLFATNLKDDMISITKENSYLRSFASMSNETGQITLWILNKNNNGESIQIDFNNYTSNNILSEFEYTASNPDALNYTYNVSNHVVLNNNQITGTIPAHSILVLTLDEFIDSDARNTIFQNTEQETVLQNTSIVATDPFHYIQGASHSSTGQNSRWETISKDNNWVLLENAATKEHLYSDGNSVFSAPTSYIGNYAQWEKIPTGNKGEFYLLNREWNKYLNCTNSTVNTTEKHINLSATTISSTLWKNWEEPNILNTITKENKELSIEIYPTVVLNELTINLEALKGETIQIRSFDTLGRTTFFKNIKINTSVEKLVLQVAYLKQGIFFLEIKTSKGAKIVRLIKQ